MLDVIDRVFGPELVVPFLLGGDSDEALHDAALWMYMHHAATAYACYLEQGRGVLVGRLGADEHGGELDSAQLKATIQARKECGLSVGYIEPTEPYFWDEIPASIRDSMMEAMKTYDPEQEVLILLMRDGEWALIGSYCRGSGFETSPRVICTRWQGGGQGGLSKRSPEAGSHVSSVGRGLTVPGDQR